MTYTRPVRSALLGISVATAALLTGFTASGDAAVTHANGGGPPCGAQAPKAAGQNTTVTASPTLVVHNGPWASCPAYSWQFSTGQIVTYFSDWGGYAWVMDPNTGYTGWVNTTGIDMTPPLIPTNVGLCRFVPKQPENPGGGCYYEPNHRTLRHRHSPQPV